jgi:DNA modification methylase
MIINFAKRLVDKQNCIFVKLNINYDRSRKSIDFRGQSRDLKNTESECIDLIYLDPPFFSNRNYEVIWGDAGEVRSFQDRWSGGVDHYIAWLKERVIEMHRILKPTGSIFLHCDWHADAYIRVEILNKVFGYGNFNSQVTWERTTNSGSSNIVTFDEI